MERTSYSLSCTGGRIICGTVIANRFVKSEDIYAIHSLKPDEVFGYQIHGGLEVSVWDFLRFLWARKEILSI